MTIVTDYPFRCPWCGMVSHNPNDARERYCGHCHRFVDDGLLLTGRYTLDADGNPVAEPDLFRWAQWYETAERHVAHDVLADGHTVSTVFLGLDHGFARLLDGRAAPPVLWETMVFNDYGALDGFTQRYTSRAAALEGHAQALEALKRRLKLVC